jgi:hypothetical protein
MGGMEDRHDTPPRFYAVNFARYVGILVSRAVVLVLVGVLDNTLLMGNRSGLEPSEICSCL